VVTMNFAFLQTKADLGANNNCTCHDLLIDINCRRAVVVSVRISAVNGSGWSHASQLLSI